MDNGEQIEDRLYLELERTLPQDGRAFERLDSSEHDAHGKALDMKMRMRKAAVCHLRQTH